MSHLDILKEAFGRVGIKYTIVPVGDYKHLFFGDKPKNEFSQWTEHFIEFNENGEVASY